MKTGKNRSNYAKTGRFLGIYFSSAAEFLPCFFGGVDFFSFGSLSAKISTLVFCIFHAILCLNHSNFRAARYFSLSYSNFQLSRIYAVEKCRENRAKISISKISWGLNKDF